ncbi:MAG: serine/threonine-protein kinase [Myxococcaceae bacterium]
MESPVINRDTVSGDALFILKNLKENGKLSRSNKLADVKASLEPSVSLEFDSYFFFLRKFHYIAMDREAQLRLTEQGEQVVDGEALDKFSDEVGEFFADQLGPVRDEQTQVGEAPKRRPSRDSENALLDALPSAKPPVPPAPPMEEDISLEDAPVSPPPSRPRKSSSMDDAPVTRSNDAIEPARSSYAPPSVATAPTSGAPASSGAPVAGGKGGTEIDMRYMKFDPVGSGPLGTVFKGRQNALGLEVCVKELKDIFGYFSFLQRGEVIKRLKKELCAQAGVRHPGVVAILDQNTDVARPYFVMELLKGSLREKLDAANGKGISAPLAVRYFLQLMYALRAAHSAGLAHHNIKPENVLFDQYGNAKVGDFGLSRVIEVDQSKGMPQVFVGTGGMGYMAPELIAKSKDLGPSSDIYGLGILLYEMLTGQIPGRRSPLPSEVNSEVPSKLDPIFDKMTQDRKESRYSDFDAVLSDFYSAFSDGEYLARNDLVLWSDTSKP